MRAVFTPRLVEEEPDTGGRPLALVPDERTLRTIEGVAGVMCTIEEIAAVLGVTKKTFITFKNKHAAVREAWEKGRELGRVSLRRKQFKLADKNAQMAIRLGELYLGQRTESTQQHVHQHFGLNMPSVAPVEVSRIAYENMLLETAPRSKKEPLLIEGTVNKDEE